MKDLGVSRPIDRLGRIVLPKEIRKQLDIKDNDRLDIFVEKNRIILEKITKRCDSCGSEENLAACGNVILCYDCAKRISENIKNQFEVE